MLQFLQIANGEGFFWLIVIIASIAGQIAKASKRSQQRKTRDQTRDSGAPQQESQRTGPVSPQDELREFLKSLTGAELPARTTASRPAQNPLKQPAVRQVQTPAHQPAMPVGDLTPTVASLKRAQPLKRRRKGKAGPVRVARLAGANTLRSAILWREILGTPVAMRKTVLPR